MSKLSSNSLLSQPRNSHLDHDPLAIYESQSVGNEFLAHVPKGAEHRARVVRQDAVILKNWRSVASDKSSGAKDAQKDRVLNMRDYETKRVLDSERMFIVVLAGMTFLLGCIFLYFVMNFRF